MRPEWKDFVGGKWENEVNVRDFIQKNYHPYDGDESFLAEATQNTKDLWQMVLDLQKKEREAGGVLDMDTKVVSTITSHGPGYLDKSKETIVGFRQISPSSVLSSLTAVLEWLKKPALTTVMKLTLKSANSSQHTERLIMPDVLMLTMQR